MNLEDKVKKNDDGKRVKNQKSLFNKLRDTINKKIIGITTTVILATPFYNNCDLSECYSDYNCLENQVCINSFCKKKEKVKEIQPTEQKDENECSNKNDCVEENICYRNSCEKVVLANDGYFSTRTNSNGQGFFYDTLENDKLVIINAIDASTNEPLEKIIVNFRNSSNLKGYVLRDPSNVYLPTMIPKSHNSEHTIKMEKRVNGYFFIKKFTEEDGSIRLMQKWESLDHLAYTTNTYKMTIDHEDLLEMNTRTQSIINFCINKTLSLFAISSSIDIGDLLNHVTPWYGNNPPKRWDIYKTDGNYRVPTITVVPSNIPSVVLENYSLDGSWLNLNWQQGIDKTNYNEHRGTLTEDDITVLFGPTEEPDLNYEIILTNRGDSFSYFTDNLNQRINLLNYGQYEVQLVVKDEVNNKGFSNTFIFNRVYVEPCSDECNSNENGCVDQNTKWNCQIGSDECYDKVNYPCNSQQVCYRGDCIDSNLIACYTDEDCGIDGYNNTEICDITDNNLEAILKDYIQYDCINPGQRSSYCYESVSPYVAPLIIEECQIDQNCVNLNCVPCVDECTTLDEKRCDDRERDVITICSTDGDYDSCLERTYHRRCNSGDVCLWAECVLDGPCSNDSDCLSDQICKPSTGECFDKPTPLCQGTNCINAIIKISDNGNVLDDSFGLEIKNSFYGETSIGGSRTWQVPMTEGQTYQMKAYGIGIPDGIGTYLIELTNSQSISGPPLSGNDLDAGQSHTWTIKPIRQ